MIPVPVGYITAGLAPVPASSHGPLPTLRGRPRVRGRVSSPVSVRIGTCAAARPDRSFLSGPSGLPESACITSLAASTASASIRVWSVPDTSGSYPRRFPENISAGLIAPGGRPTFKSTARKLSAPVSKTIRRDGSFPSAVSLREAKTRRSDPSVGRSSTSFDSREPGGRR